MHIKAIIFDMDGLLIDSEPVWFNARKIFCKQLNIEWTWDHQRDTMGVSTAAWVKYMRTLLGEQYSNETILNGVVDKMTEAYKSGGIEMMPGADEAIKFCYGKYKIGIASGSYKVLLHTAIEANDWNKYLNEILSSDDMQRGKPHPDVYLETAKRLNVKPEECIVLEDSRDGIRAGVAAGANVIAVPSKEIVVPQEVLETAYKVIDSLHELPEILLQIND